MQHTNMYDYNAGLHGIRNLSLLNLKDYRVSIIVDATASNGQTTYT